MEKRLDEIADIFTGIRTSRFNKENTNLKPVFSRTKILNQENSLNYSLEPISDEINEKYYSKKYDILILLSNPEYIFQIETEEVIIPMEFAVIRVKKEYNPIFIYHLLKYKIISREIRRLVEGSVLKIIKTSYLREIKIPVVEKEKQEKCGNLLEVIDRRINLNKQKIEMDELIVKDILNKILEDE